MSRVSENLIIPFTVGELAQNPNENIFGPLVATWDVEETVIRTLASWLPVYLSESERKHGLARGTLPRPQAEHSIHGGVDFDTWRSDLNPEVIVVVEPEGEAEREASIGYTQNYTIQVGCMWAGSFGSELAELPEDEARMIASFYGSALMLLTQVCPLGFGEIVMTGAPRLSLPYPDKRSIALSTTTYHAFVSPIIEQNAGVPAQEPSESPFYGGESEAPFKELPAVEKTNLKLKAESIGEHVH